MSRKLRLRGVLLGVLLITLAGCGTTQTTVVSETCLVMERIDYHSINDTEATIQQIREHNAVLDALNCP